MASEVGVLEIAPENIRSRNASTRARSSSSTRQGRIVDDEEIKRELAPRAALPALAGRAPDRHRVTCPTPRVCRNRHPRPCCAAAGVRLHRRGPAAAARADGAERRRGPRLDGHRHALAVLSDRRGALFDYFKQLFAQVTNPPLDAIREELITSMASTIGPRATCSIRAGVVPADRGQVPEPILSNEEWRSCARRPRECGLPIRSHCIGRWSFDLLPAAPLRRDLPMLSTRRGRSGARPAMDAPARPAVAAGYNILILSDRGITPPDADPSLLATAGVHHHLVREGAAHQVRAGRRIGRRARSAPLRAAARLRRRRGEPVSGVRDARRHDPAGHAAGPHHAKAVSNYIKALNKGILKVMSKMGISTLQSHCGAQIFEAIGLSQAFVDR